MNFIKLIPIFFLALPSGEGRPLEQQILPAIPGYVPVYIQTGNIPPNIEALYQQAGQTMPLSAREEDGKINDDVEKKEKEVPIIDSKKEITEEKIIHEKKALHKPKGQIKEISHYEVKEVIEDQK